MHYLSKDFINAVYDSLQGSLVPEAHIVGVKNLFLNGSPCDRAYSNILNAYERLLSKLNETDEDPDVEIIIASFFTILRISGEEMYRCGAAFALLDG